jgi:hypothetical protein
VKIYVVVVVEELKKKERQGETQETIIKKLMVFLSFTLR